MSRPNVLLFVGVLVLLSPFSGLPLSMLEWILPVLGALVIFLGFLFRTEEKAAPLPTVEQSPEMA